MMIGDNVTDNWFVLKDILPCKTFNNLYELINPIDNNYWVLDSSSVKRYPNLWTIKKHSQLLPFYDAGIYIKYKIQKHIKHNLVLTRIQVNGQTSNQNGEFHVDDKLKCYYTFVLFSNISWDMGCGGNFNFYHPEEKEYHSIPYMPNTGVLIPSYWEHYGSAPSSNTDKLRTTIAFMYDISGKVNNEL